MGHLLGDNPCSIGVIDSGSGGLPAAALLTKAGFHVCYLADSAKMPYGSLSSLEIDRRVACLARALVDLGARQLFCACHSMCVNTDWPTLEQSCGIPASGITTELASLLRESAKTYSRPIVAATPATLASSFFKVEFANAVTYHPLPMPRLASLIEAGSLSEAFDDLARSLDGVPDWNEDGVLALACTHYPLISDRISARFPRLHVIDPLVRLEIGLAELFHGPSGAVPILLTTRSTPAFRERAELLYPGVKVRQVELNEGRSRLHPIPTPGDYLTNL